MTSKSALTSLKGKILFVEDDDIVVSVVGHRLVREGLEVVHFKDGAEAFQQASEVDASLVILDVKLPGMDGFELLKRLRSSPVISNVPIIMLTGMGSEKDIVRGMELGASDYILKPFSPSELLARIRRFLKVHP